MKKTAVILIAVAMILSLAGCKSKTPEPPVPVEKTFVVVFDEERVSCATWPMGDPVKSGSKVTESNSLDFTAKINEDEQRVDYWVISDMEKKNTASRYMNIEVGVENATLLTDGTYRITADYVTHETIYATLDYDYSSFVAHKGKTVYEPGTVLTEGVSFEFRPIFSEGQLVDKVYLNGAVTNLYYPTSNYVGLTVNKDTVKDGKISVSATFKEAGNYKVTNNIDGISLKKLDYYKCYVTEEESTRQPFDPTAPGASVSEYDHIYFYNEEGKLATNLRYKLVSTADTNKYYEIKEGAAGIFLKPEVLEALGNGNFEIRIK